MLDFNSFFKNLGHFVNDTDQKHLLDDRRYSDLLALYLTVLIYDNLLFLSEFIPLG